MEHAIETLRREETLLSSKISRLQPGRSQREAKSLLRQVKDAIRLLTSEADKMEYMKGYLQGLKDCGKEDSPEVLS